MIGREFNESYIKMVQLKETPQGQSLCCYNIAPVELKASEGDLDASIAGTIEKLISQADISDTDVCTLVSGAMVQVRRVSLPPMPEVDLIQAVKFEAHNFTTFPVSETVVDYHVIEKAEGKESRKLDVMILVIEKNAFKRLLATINRAGLRSAGVTIAAFALKELLPGQPSFVPAELTAVLDIGAGSAVLSLFRDNVVQFVREISLGDQLQSEVLSSFTYFREQFFEEKIVRLYLSGEIAQVKDLQATLATGLGIPVETIDPLRGVVPGPKVDVAKLHEDAPRLALVIGLARNAARDLNLVKVKEKAPKKGKQKKIEPGAALTTLATISNPNTLVIGLLIFTVGIILALNFYLTRSMERTKKDLQVKSLRLEQLTSFQERKLTYEEVRGKRTEVRTLLGQITRLLPVRTTLMELSYDNAKRHFTLAGETDSPGSVSRFIMKLDQSAEFGAVKLKEIKKTGPATVFSLEFELKKGAAE